jgi:hypothetical protein
MSIQSFAKAANIRRFQNLLETSVDEAERGTLRRLLVEEKAKPELKAPEPGRL